MMDSGSSLMMSKHSVVSSRSTAGSLATTLALSQTRGYDQRWAGAHRPGDRAGRPGSEALPAGRVKNITPNLDQTGSPYEDADGYNYGLGVNPFGPVAGSKVLDSKDSWCTDASPTTLISTTYTSGGRIVNNSWGLFPAGQYSVQAQEYDARVRDAQPGGGPYAGNQEITVIFAAGNFGPRATTIVEPGTAKNVITVGAAENYRPGWTDGCRMGPEHADTAQDVAYFSSHGPCVDGRVKPDLVAPGTNLLGAASQYAGYSGTGVCDK